MDALTGTLLSSLSFCLYWSCADAGKITDLHPDSHYFEGTLARTGCHHNPDDEHNMTSMTQHVPQDTECKR